MARSGKSVIPQAKQIPVAIGLSLVLIVILIWRFAPSTDKEPEAAVLPKEQTLAPSLTAEELARLTGELRACRVPEPPDRPPYTGLETDPFRWTAPSAAAATSGSPQAPVPEPSGPARAALSLSGTYVGGDASLALVDGRRVRVGDVIDGRTVTEIGPRHVVLETGGRTETIRLSENPKL